MIFHAEDSGIVYFGNSLDWLPLLPDASVHAIVTDPPYELGFMGKSWDSSGIAYNVDLWREGLRVLKPGGYLLSFGGSRTYHRMACAIEDAGFEIRDMIEWIYGSGFPKSLDVSKAIDKAAGAERAVVGRKTDPRYDSGVPDMRGGNFMSSKPGVMDCGDITAPATDGAKQWDGWGTALKPSHEPICVARKPLIGTVVANVLAHGCGAINVDGCRIEVDPNDSNIRDYSTHERREGSIWGNAEGADKNLGDKGRWPTNIVIDEEAGRLIDEQSGHLQSGQPRGIRAGNNNNVFGQFAGGIPVTGIGDSGGASRFYYCAKASAEDRGYGNDHPTVKPHDLMRWLVRLVTPPGGTVLDPFGGSGSTACAAKADGFKFVTGDLVEHHCDIAVRRLGAVNPRLDLFTEVV